AHKDTMIVKREIANGKFGHWLILGARRLGRDARARTPSQSAVKLRQRLQAFATQVVDQVADAAGVSPLVVVPGDDFDAVAADYHGRRRIDDRGASVAFEIGGDEFMLLETEIALE